MNGTYVYTVQYVAFACVFCPGNVRHVTLFSKPATATLQNTVTLETLCKTFGQQGGLDKKFPDADGALHNFISTSRSKNWDKR